MASYIVIITVIGAAALLMAWLPQLLDERPLSYPIVFLLLGGGLYLLPIKLIPVDTFYHEDLIVRLTELCVIVTLMGTGIKINREFSWRDWHIPLRLVTITMLCCIGGVALLGWGWLGLSPAAAVLLGAVLAPTDPVLASEVQVGPPSQEKEDHVRFSLTAEAGLNDGMAFPFTWLAVVMAVSFSTGEPWLKEWLLRDLLYRVVAGVALGYGIGRLLAWLLFYLPRKTRFPKTRDGFVALSATLLVYGVTELAHGYGFIAVFVAGITISAAEERHEYRQELHSFTDQIERLLMVIVLIPFAGALVTTDLLHHLTWKGAGLGLLLLFVIRPLSAMLTLVRTPLSFREKLAVSFFGIRGIGSFFYLAFALDRVAFAEAAELWSITAFIVLVSIVLHGISASPVMRHLDLRRGSTSSAPTLPFRDP